MAKTVAVIYSQDSSISGVISFDQLSEASETIIKGKITGLKPGKHALAIHSFGDISKVPDSLGKHFNPFSRNHGAPNVEERHIGSLGNIEADEKGNANFETHDKLVKLIGPLSVIGRSVVIYTSEDDLGKGGAEYSLVNGNAGPILAYGVIGISK